MLGVAAMPACTPQVPAGVTIMLSDIVDDAGEAVMGLPAEFARGALPPTPAAAGGQRIGKIARPPACPPACLPCTVCFLGCVQEAA